jgi:hypothetical protein
VSKVAQLLASPVAETTNQPNDNGSRVESSPSRQIRAGRSEDNNDGVRGCLGERSNAATSSGQQALKGLKVPSSKATVNSDREVTALETVSSPATGMSPASAHASDTGELMSGSEQPMARDGVGATLHSTLDPGAKAFVPSTSATEGTGAAGCEETAAPLIPEVLGTRTVGAGGCTMSSRSLWVQGEVEGVPVRFLVDTGAQVTMINHATLERLPHEARKMFATTQSTVTTVSGQVVPSWGPIPVRLQVNGEVVIEDVRVLEMEPEAILGYSTMRAIGLEIRIAGECLIAAEPRGTDSLGEPSHVCHVTVAVGAFELLPRSEAVVLCALDGRNDVVDWLVEGLPEGPDAKLRVAHSVARGPMTLVRVMNPTSQSVMLSEGELIATATAGEVVETCGNRPEEPRGGEIPEHLRQLWQQTIETEKLPDQAAEGLSRLLCRHSRLFATEDMDLGRTSVVVHDVDTGDAAPIRQPPRRPPIALQPQMDAEINKMLEAGVIEPGQSPWSSPVVLARKKDGSIRFCVDYRKLNAVTRFDAYPLPRMDETFEALCGAKFFSTLDLISGYWQVGMTEQARLKTAFTTRNGLYLWKVMPFGLCNAPSTFERLMEAVLAGLQWHTCLVYLDDIVVFASTHEQMLTRLNDVFTCLGAAGLKLKPRKCHLFARETEYLGHVISEAGVKVNPHRVTAITEWPIPCCVTEVRSFLGTASYYRKFVRNFAMIASPLHKLTQTGAQWAWGEEEQRSFDKLKVALSTAPVLPFPASTGQFVLDTDASDTGIGAVLSQVIDGKEMVLGYASRTLSKAERNYCVTRRELLAVIHFIRHFRPYLYAQHFIIRTDHASLTWLTNFRDPEGQIARWLQVLGEYYYDIAHRPGKQHGNADGLSRQTCGKCDQCGREHVDPRPKRVKVRLTALTPRWSESDFRAAQLDDPELVAFALAVESGTKPTPDEADHWPRTSRFYLRDWDRMKLVSGVLARQWYHEDGSLTHFQWVVPRCFVKAVLTEAHANPVSGHFDPKRTKARAREAFYWMGMDTDSRMFCRACVTCGARKPAPTAPHHPVQRQVTTEPLQRIAVDILTLSPRTPRGHKYVLVIVDYFTKWVTAVPMRDETTISCATALVHNFICWCGMPEALHSDRGAQFESKLWQQACRLLGIHKTRTTPRHPQSDGQTERSNRTLEDILAKLAKDDRENWDLYLPYACLAYNTSVHSVTGETPMNLLFGREARTPVTLLAPPPPQQEEQVEWVERMHDRFRRSYRAVVKRTQAHHRRTTPWTDRKQKGYSFAEGDLVWVYDPKPKVGYTPKLDAQLWSGPWRVVKKISSCVYLVVHQTTQRRTVINVDAMSPYTVLDKERFPSAGNTSDEDMEDSNSDGSDNTSGDRKSGSGERWSSSSDMSRSDVEVTDEEGALNNEEGHEPPLKRDVALPLTYRPRRTRPAPQWLGDYDCT